VPGTDFELLVRLTTLEGRRLASFGVLDVELALLRRLLRPGDTFVDVGANVGVFSLAAAAAVGPTGRVIACEPAAGTMQLLRHSVALNEAWWVELHETALSDYHGTAEFVTFEPGSALSSFAPKRRTAGTSTTVPVTSVDELVAGRADDVALVKIDAEGAELHVVRGAEQLFATRKPSVIVELEPEHLRRQGASVEEFTDFFTRLGYSAYGITRSGAVGQSIPAPWTRPETGEPNLFLAAA
jgi:FkbM family methyltransferase